MPSALGLVSQVCPQSAAPGSGPKVNPGSGPKVKFFAAKTSTSGPDPSLPAKTSTLLLASF